MDREVPLLVGNRTEVGPVREANEDYLGYYSAGGRHLFLVADGMGGEAGGALASRAAVEAAEATFAADPWRPSKELLAGAVAAANRACRELRRSCQGVDRLGTTLDLVLICERRVWWAHVGDGRIYRVHDGEVDRLTDDHTVIQRMVREGLLGEEEARNHPNRHVLERALGSGDEVVPDLAEQPLVLEEGQSVVICTDGLTDVVSPTEVVRAIEDSGPQGACNRLVDLVGQREGSDNVTIQIVHFGRARKRWSRASKLGQVVSAKLRAAVWIALVALGLLLGVVLVFRSASATAQDLSRGDPELEGLVSAQGDGAPAQGSEDQVPDNRAPALLSMR